MYNIERIICWIISTLMMQITEEYFLYNFQARTKLNRSIALDKVVSSKILKVLAIYPYPLGSWTTDQRSVISHWSWWLHFDIFEILTNLNLFYIDLDITIVFCVPKYPLFHTGILLTAAVCPGWTFVQIPRLSGVGQIRNMLPRFFRNACEFRSDVPNPSLNITYE